jgi:fumarate hydratase subunit beta
MATYTLTTPLSDDDVRQLKAGDVVYLSGIIYTARDAAHKKLMEALDAGQPLPFELQG